jgi:hypothetical protein
MDEIRLFDVDPCEKGALAQENRAQAENTMTPTTFPFSWNEFADQPHNVAPRSERIRHHIRRWQTYVSLVWADIRFGLPALPLYRHFRKKMYRKPVPFSRSMFGVSISPAGSRSEEAVALLEDTGVRETLIRIPSWDKDKLDAYERFAALLSRRGFGLTIALLQKREDVFEAAAWAKFIEDVFARFRPFCRAYEIGHAWNRTKWGVWDYTEYLKIARPAFELREKYGIALVGPAVIDFEFHLYPPTLSALPFDISSSLLYVDRVGAPENGQFGWTTAMKVALFKAVTESSARKKMDCWITEVNWPLTGIGKYSPASGRPNVTEEEQADYLVRYYVICLASGLIERVYWWQLAAPGYGLVNSLEEPWRKRPSFLAMKAMLETLAGGEFVRKDRGLPAEVYHFRNEGKDMAVCWTARSPRVLEFPRKVARVMDRDGRRADVRENRVEVGASPKYVLFE